MTGITILSRICAIQLNEERVGTSSPESTKTTMAMKTTEGDRFLKVILKRIADGVFTASPDEGGAVRFLEVTQLGLGHDWIERR
jgi:hypothetical protein